MASETPVVRLPDGSLWAYNHATGAWVQIPVAGLVLTDTSGQSWMVTADTDGTLVTAQHGGAGEDQVQVGPYMLSVDTDGALVTTEA